MPTDNTDRDPGREDSNQQAVQDWTEDTTPRDRVRAIMARTYDPQSVEDIADRSCVPPVRTEHILHQLQKDGRVSRVHGDDKTWWHRDPSAIARDFEDRINEATDRIREAATKDDPDPDEEFKAIADALGVTPDRVRDLFQAVHDDGN